MTVETPIRPAPASKSQDALAHIEDLAWTGWRLLNDYRRMAARVSREDPAHHAYRMVADRHAFYVCRLLAIRRALKEGTR